MNEKTKKLVYAAALLAICIVSQFFKNLSVYITGPIVNTCLILCLLTAGPVWAVILSIITPITAFIITASPIMQAIPAIIPCIMIGNIILVLSIHLLRNRIKGEWCLHISMIIGSVAKALFMGLAISLIIVPMLLPEKMLPKMYSIQMTFSVTQLITAIIGSAFALIIWTPLKKSIEK